jgi:hypothetical protein
MIAKKMNRECPEDEVLHPTFIHFSWSSSGSYACVLLRRSVDAFPGLGKRIREGKKET